jgi:hypothetical protein
LLKMALNTITLTLLCDLNLNFPSQSIPETGVTGLAGGNHGLAASHWQTFISSAWVGFKLKFLVVISIDWQVVVNQLYDNDHYRKKYSWDFIYDEVCWDLSLVWPDTYSLMSDRTHGTD